LRSPDNTTIVLSLPRPLRVGGAEVVLWCRDTVSCLQATLATVLRNRGWDPVEALGGRFEFRFVPEDRPDEEFYYPCGTSGLRDRLFPFHDVVLDWQVADGPAQGLDALRAGLGQGYLPIAAVDNYHMPFRPAYRDVHAAHLVVVCGVGDGTVTVSDAMPPAFQGPVPTEAFLAGWFSANPRDHQDVFFSGRPIAGRWLRVRAPAPPAQPGATSVRTVLEHNVETYRGAGDEHGGARALAGLRAYIDAVVATGAPHASLTHLYTYGWSLQAQASLHAEWLRHHAGGARERALAELAATVDRVCTAWTGLRVRAAHQGDEPARWAPQLRSSADRLAHAYGAAVAGMEQVLAAGVTGPAAPPAALVES
jgi:hypothetical protein